MLNMPPFTWLDRSQEKQVVRWDVNWKEMRLPHLHLVLPLSISNEIKL